MERMSRHGFVPSPGGGGVGLQPSFGVATRAGARRGRGCRNLG